MGVKTFKQLRESWFTSQKSSWNHKEVKIYLNPTFQELAEAQYDGRGGFRAFLLSNGNMYAWGTEFHMIIRKTIGEIRMNSIPITGRFRNRSKVDVVMSNDIVLPMDVDEYDTESYKNFYELTKEKVKNHRHFKKLFSKMEFKEERFLG